jgi:predicted P-loop ATPase
MNADTNPVRMEEMRKLNHAVERCRRACYGNDKKLMLARITELTGFMTYKDLKEHPDVWPRVIEALSAQTTETRATAAGVKTGALVQDPNRLARLKSLAGIARKDNGEPICNTMNALMYVEELFGDRLKFDTFANRILIEWQSGTGWRPWTDADDVRLQVGLQSVGLTTLSKNAASDAALVAAEQHKFSVIAEWLDSLKWDGTKRLSTWMSRAFGVAPSRYHMRVGRNWLIAMVARAQRPGCKVDEVVVLESEQGLRKTQAFEVLGGEYFRELTASPDSKDFEQQLSGVWLGEFSELATIKRAEDVERIKQFITNRVDHYRPSYGKKPADFPRQIVFCGSTNAQQWAHDTTGARRFMPVKIGKIDLAWLKANRDQLFAEAMDQFKAGRHWWVYPKEQARAEQAERMVSDPWDQTIARYLRGRVEVTAQEILSVALRIGVSDQTKAHVTRVGQLLKQLKCEPLERRRIGGVQMRVLTVSPDLASQSADEEWPVNVDANDPLDVSWMRT